MSDIRQMLEVEARRANHGVISRREAKAAGLTIGQIDRRVRRRQWRPSGFRGQLILADCWDDPRAHLRCAITALNGIAWRRSAMAIHGLARHPPEPEILSLGQSRRVSARINRYDRTVWRMTTRNGLLCLTIEDTVASMAGIYHPDRFDELVDRVILEGRTQWRQLAIAFKRVRRQGRLGSALLGRVLEDRDGETAVPLSVWSRRFARGLDDAGLPPTEMEWRIEHHGRLVAQVDLAFPSARYAIELDSVSFHLNRAAFEEDRRRDADLATAGWLVRRFTWRQFQDRFPWVVRVVRADLASRPPA